jgi:hypothetical protein
MTGTPVEVPVPNKVAVTGGVRAWRSAGDTFVDTLGLIVM